MYTNIDTGKSLRIIGDCLQRRSHLFKNIPIEAIMQGLSIIMQNNLFRFGDTYWHQIDGTAMGTPPAPMYATIFFWIKEATFLPSTPNI